MRLVDLRESITWRKGDLGWMGEFQTPRGRWFKIAISRLKRESEWAFEFSEIPPYVLWVTGRADRPDDESLANSLSDNPVGGLAPTGRGEQFAVVSMIVEAMKDFLQEERPERVRFKGATSRQSKLYRSILAHHADEIARLGYRHRETTLIRQR